MQNLHISPFVARMISLASQVRQAELETELAYELELLNIQPMPHNARAKTPEDRASTLVAQLQQMDCHHQAAIADAVTQLSKTLGLPVNKTVQLFAARSLRAVLLQALLARESSPHTSPAQPTETRAAAESADPASVAPAANPANPATAEPTDDAQPATASKLHDANETVGCLLALLSPRRRDYPASWTSTLPALDRADALLRLIDCLVQSDQANSLFSNSNPPSQTGKTTTPKIAG